ncbi:MAG: universal stress protein [Nitrosopumilus sp.]|nr:universal stress protein [Nitrosopumilus sp.]NNL59656.1 universal stress protein [Nitrosopumilus sp.]
MANGLYKKILVPLDGSKCSERAFVEATTLAKQCDAKLVGLYVVPFSPLSYREIRVAKETMFVEAKKNLAKVKTNAEKKGLVLQEKILQGNPGELISNFANQSKNKVDLIVMGSRGRGGLKEAFLGSVSNYVMHKSKVPIMIIK